MHVYVSVYVCVCVYVCVYICNYVCVCVIYVCVYVCVYTIESHCFTFYLLDFYWPKNFGISSGLAFSATCSV